MLLADNFCPILFMRFINVFTHKRSVIVNEIIEHTVGIYTPLETVVSYHYSFVIFTFMTNSISLQKGTVVHNVQCFVALNADSRMLTRIYVLATKILL